MYTTGLLVTPLLLTLVSAFPNGAHNNGSNPMDALSSYCTAGNFRPNHGSYLPQNSPSPFSIEVSSPMGTMYSPGRVVTITIKATPSTATPGTPSNKIKGFFIQGDSTESAFAGDIMCTQGKKVTFCGKTGVTHTHAKPKERIVCKWSPPDFQIGNVQFTATVLQNFTTFWTGVKSGDTLIADPQTMTYQQKANQLSQKMMQQFQGSAQSVLNMFKQQVGGNPMANLFGGANSGNGNNALTTLMNSFSSGGSNVNQFASMFSNNGGGNDAQNNAFASLMGGNAGASAQGETANYWQQLASGNQNQRSNSNSGFDLNNFRQFFQN